MVSLRGAEPRRPISVIFYHMTGNYLPIPALGVKGPHDDERTWEAGRPLAEDVARATGPG